MPRFAIRRLQTGPDELRAQLPITGHTVDRRTNPHGTGEFFYSRLDQRLKHRFSRESNAARVAGERADRDDRGPFVWVSAVILSAYAPGEQLHVGMREFAVDLAYVVDSSLSEDSVMDPARVDYVGVVEIDDDVDNLDAPAPRTNGIHLASTTSPPRVVVPLVSPNAFQPELDQMTAALASLAGERYGGDAVVPQRIESGAEPIDGVPTYSLDVDALRYRTWDPLHGWVLRETTDAEALLYWIVDDMASGIAWRWAQHAPAFAEMGEYHAVRTLWMPYWHILVYGLRPDWGRRTRESIRALAQGNPRPLQVRDRARQAATRIPEAR